MVASKPWPKPALDTLRFLWTEKGYSATQIAMEISGPARSYSRNAVIGQIHRLGLSHRGDPFKRKRMTKPKKRSTKRKVRKFNTKPPQAKEEPLLNAPLSLKRTILTVGPGECRYTPDNGPFLFCGHLTVEGRSWCAYHDAVCSEPVRRARSDFRWDNRAWRTAA